MSKLTELLMGSVLNYERQPPVKPGRMGGRRTIHAAMQENADDEVLADALRAFSEQEQVRLSCPFCPAPVAPFVTSKSYLEHLRTAHPDYVAKVRMGR